MLASAVKKELGKRSPYVCKPCGARQFQASACRPAFVEGGNGRRRAQEKPWTRDQRVTSRTSDPPDRLIDLNIREWCEKFNVIKTDRHTAGSVFAALLTSGRDAIDVQAIAQKKSVDLSVIAAMGCILVRGGASGNARLGNAILAGCSGAGDATATLTLSKLWTRKNTSSTSHRLPLAHLQKLARGKYDDQVTAKALTLLGLVEKKNRNVKLALNHFDEATKAAQVSNAFIVEQGLDDDLIDSKLMNPSPIHQSLADPWYEKGLVLKDVGLHKEAKQAFEVSAFKVDNPDAYHELAMYERGTDNKPVSAEWLHYEQKAALSDVYDAILNVAKFYSTPTASLNLEPAARKVYENVAEKPTKTWRFPLPYWLSYWDHLRTRKIAPSAIHSAHPYSSTHAMQAPRGAIVWSMEWSSLGTTFPRGWRAVLYLVGGLYSLGLPTVGAGMARQFVSGQFSELVPSVIQAGTHTNDMKLIEARADPTWNESVTPGRNKAREELRARREARVELDHAVGPKD